MSELKVRSVSWLVRQIASTLDQAAVLHGVVLEAEISNFHAHSSGHWYFSLKDEHARIDATMWENDNLLVSFLPKDGDKVRVLGNVAIYQVQGKIQFTVRKMVKAGAGDLKAMFDALYKKLDGEGLFAVEHKKPIPRYPMRIGLVTGSATHARADVYNTLGRRWPFALVTEYPALVQGEAAPAELIAALKKADQGSHDVILLCRGGGSAEDLWCFNDEQLARTIYAMHTPVITGVGHEPDWTMVDYVADLRAPTPTGAAERATPDQVKVRQALADARASLERLMKQRLTMERDNLAYIKGKPFFTDPHVLLRERQMQKDMLEQQFLRHLHTHSLKTRQILNERQQTLVRTVNDRLKTARDELSRHSDDLQESIHAVLEETRSQLGQKAGLLDSYSPLKVLERGYSVVTKNTAVITDAGLLEPGDQLNIRLHKGSVIASVTEVKENTNDKA